MAHRPFGSVDEALILRITRSILGHFDRESELDANNRFDTLILGHRESRS